jgi:hypothetical protein
VPAIEATIIIGITTLVSAAGIARGWKRAFAVTLTCRATQRRGRAGLVRAAERAEKLTADLPGTSRAP